MRSCPIGIVLPPFERFEFKRRTRVQPGNADLRSSFIPQTRATESGFLYRIITELLEGEVAARAAASLGALVGRFAGCVERLGEQASDRSRRFATSSRSHPERPPDAPLRPDRKPWGKYGQNEENDARCNDCSDHHVSLRVRSSLSINRGRARNRTWAA